MAKRRFAVAGNLLAQTQVPARLGVEKNALERAASFLERTSTEVLAVKPEEIEGLVDRLVGCLMAGVAASLAHAESGLKGREARDTPFVFDDGLAAKDGRCNRQ